MAGIIVFRRTSAKNSRYAERPWLRLPSWKIIERHPEPRTQSWLRGIRWDVPLSGHQVNGLSSPSLALVQTALMKPIAAFPTILALAGVLVACSGAYRRPDHTTPPGPPDIPTAPGGVLRDVVLVGNNWAGTVAAFDPITYQILAVVDVVPDWEARISQIKSNVIRKAAFDLIREVAGEGHNQLVDDVFTSVDGRYLFASRPSLTDVVAINLDKREIAWRTPVEGSRADHAAISPDGRTLLVSASTARTVHAIETATGKIVGSFESGDEPHESNYSPDGSKIYHASIGRVFLPTTSRALDFLKGERVFQVVDARTLKVLEKFDMREKSKEAGEEWVHAAVRPMAIAPDGRFVYFQMSFYHGFFEFDVDKKAITQRVQLRFRKASESCRCASIN